MEDPRYYSGEQQAGPIQGEYANLYPPTEFYPQQAPPTDYIPPEVTLNRIATPEMARSAIETTLLGDLQYSILPNRYMLKYPLSNRVAVRSAIHRSIGERITNFPFTVIDLARMIASYSIGGIGGGFFGGLLYGTGIDVATEKMFNEMGINALPKFFEERSFVRGLSKSFVPGVLSKDISGSGFTPSQAGDITRYLKEIAKEEGKTIEDINKELTDYTNLGLMGTVNSVDDFKKKFDSLRKSVKDIVETFNKTREEAIETITEFSMRGMTHGEITRSMLETRRLAKLTGRTEEELLSVGFKWAEAAQGSGSSPTAGFKIGQQIYAAMDVAQKAGYISHTSMWNLGGVERASDLLTQMTLHTFNDPRVDVMLRAGMENDGALRMETFLDTVTGKRSLAQNITDASRNMYDKNRFFQYAANKEQMVSSLLENVPQAGIMLTFQKIMSDFETSGWKSAIESSGRRVNLQDIKGFAKYEGVPPEMFDAMIGVLRGLNDTLKKQEWERLAKHLESSEQKIARQWQHIKGILESFGLKSKSELLANVFTFGAYGVGKRYVFQPLKEPVNAFFDEIYNSATTMAEATSQSIVEYFNKKIYGVEKFNLSKQDIEAIKKTRLQDLQDVEQLVPTVGMKYEGEFADIAIKQLGIKRAPELSSLVTKNLYKLRDMEAAGHGVYDPVEQRAAKTLMSAYREGGIAQFMEEYSRLQGSGAKIPEAATEMFRTAQSYNKWYGDRMIPLKTRMSFEGRLVTSEGEAFEEYVPEPGEVVLKTDEGTFIAPRDAVQGLQRRINVARRMMPGILKRAEEKKKTIIETIDNTQSRKTYLRVLDDLRRNEEEIQKIVKEKRKKGATSGEILQAIERYAGRVPEGEDKIKGYSAAIVAFASEIGVRDVVAAPEEMAPLVSYDTLKSAEEAYQKSLKQIMDVITAGNKGTVSQFLGISTPALDRAFEAINPFEDVSETMQGYLANRGGLMKVAPMLDEYYAAMQDAMSAETDEQRTSAMEKVEVLREKIISMLPQDSKIRDEFRKKFLSPLVGGKVRGYASRFFRFDETSGDYLYTGIFGRIGEATQARLLQMTELKLSELAQNELPANVYKEFQKLNAPVERIRFMLQDKVMQELGFQQSAIEGKSEEERFAMLRDRMFAGARPGEIGMQKNAYGMAISEQTEINKTVLQALRQILAELEDLRNSRKN